MFFTVVFALGISLGVWLSNRDSDKVPVTADVDPVVLADRAPLELAVLLQNQDDNVAIQRLRTDPNAVQQAMALPGAELAQLIQAYRAIGGTPAWLLVLGAQSRTASQDFEGAFELLAEASLVARTVDEETLITRALNSTVSLLEATNDDERLDSLLSDITYAMPERSPFFMQLALLRIEAGRGQQALGVLSQIENHRQFGAEARRLIDTIESAGTPAPASGIPLQQNGNQFVVGALLDESRSIALLIDTGAALTIVDAAVLAAMGYDLSGAPTARFTTAGGTVTAPVLTLQSIRLGDVVFGPLQVGALSIQLPANAQGLLGMNVLGEYAFFIDQERRELHLDQ